MPLNRKVKGSGLTALIDGDVIVYQAGFASDKTTYTCPDGSSFQYKKEANLHCDEYGLSKENICKKVKAEPVEHCLHSVKKMINSIIEATGAGNCIVYLSGKGNFRDELPSPFKYKGNRDNAPKPIHYYPIRDYLEDTWKAVVTEGYEADDALGIYQCNNKDTILCSPDKDLNMIPGLHYNWNKPDKGIYEIGFFEGLRNFYEQLLKGDSVDNIIGIEGIGEVKAAFALEGLDTVEDMAMETQLLYAEHGKSPEEYLVNGRLLWILRQEDEELWTPPKEKMTQWLSSYINQTKK